MAVLSYLDFFPTGVQRTAVSTAAAICRSVPVDGYEMVHDMTLKLTNLLSHHDQRIVESACACFISLGESFGDNAEHLAGLASLGDFSEDMKTD